MKFLPLVVRYRTAFYLSLLIVWALPIRAQPSDRLVIFDQSSTTSFVELDGMIYRLDLATGSLDWFAHSPPDSLFSAKTYPRRNSGVVDGNQLWWWDSSMGSVVKYDSTGGGTVYPLRASYRFFNHAAAYYAAVDAPVIFGGYGFFRASNFVVLFDEELGRWREIEHDTQTEAPRPRQRARLLYADADSALYIIGGDASESEFNTYIDMGIGGDAWVFHDKSRQYNRIDMIPELSQLLRTPALIETSQEIHGHAGFLAAGSSKGGVLPDRVLFTWWLPGENKFASFETNIPVVPDGHVVAIRADTDSIHVFQVATGSSNGVSLSVDRSVVPLPRQLTWRSLDQGSRPYLALLLVTVAALLFVGYFLNSRKAPQPFRSLLYTHGNRHLVMRVEGSDHVVSLTVPTTHVLSALLAYGDREVPLSDLIERMTTKNKYNYDSVRTITTRAIQELNSSCSKLLGRDLVYRENDPSDRRKTIIVFDPSIKIEFEDTTA